MNEIVLVPPAEPMITPLPLSLHPLHLTGKPELMLNRKTVAGNVPPVTLIVNASVWPGLMLVLEGVMLIDSGVTGAVTLTVTLLEVTEYGTDVPSSVTTASTLYLPAPGGVNTRTALPVSAFAVIVPMTTPFETKLTVNGLACLEGLLLQERIQGKAPLTGRARAE